VRRALVKVAGDTGAVMTMLPQDLVEALGVRVRRTAVVTYAGERNELRPVAGPITVIVAKRSATVECVVGPPTSEALLGQIPLEAMDLLIDCNQQRLMPRPESPYLPLLSKM
jgi:hypothetical protein